MEIAALDKLLRDKQRLFDLQQSYLHYYEEAIREHNVIGEYHGKQYITLSRKKHLDSDMGVMVTNLDEMCAYHVHEWIELSYAYSGRCKMLVKDKELILEEGQFILLNTDVPHAEGSAGEDGIFINLIFDKNYFNNHFFSQLGSENSVTRFLINALNEETSHENYLVFSSHNSERLPLLVRMLLCEYYDPSVCSVEIMNSTLIIILCELIHYYEKSANQDDSQFGNYRVAQVLRYIENNSKDCSLERTADFFGITPNYLTTQLKKHTGQSYKKLVQESRLNMAGRLLTDTSLSVREVARNCGYENMGFFNSIFKEKYDVLPGEYRKSRSND